MGLKEKLEDRIKRKELEIQEYETKISEAKAYLRGMKEALHMLPRDRQGGASAESILRPGSKVYRTFQFLKKLGNPAHITEILEGIGMETSKKERTSLSGSLGWYVRRNEIFNRPSPNTFGLINPARPANDKPPANFGLEEELEVEEEPPL